MKPSSTFFLLAVSLVACAATLRAEEAPSCSACMLPTTAVAVAVATAGAAAAPAATQAQTTCPVMKGSAIDKTLYVDYQGKRIYVCCKSCLAVVGKNPAKYVKQLEAAGVTLAAVPSTETK